MANERPSDLFPISGMETSHVQEDGCFHQPASPSDTHRASLLTDHGHAVRKQAFPRLKLPRLGTDLSRQHHLTNVALYESARVDILHVSAQIHAAQHRPENY